MAKYQNVTFPPLFVTFCFLGYADLTAHSGEMDTVFIASTGAENAHPTAKA